MTPEAAWNLGTLNAKYEMDALLGSFRGSNSNYSNRDLLQYYNNEIDYANQIIEEKNQIIDEHNFTIQNYANKINYANEIINELNLTIQIKDEQLRMNDANIKALQAKLEAALSVTDLDRQLILDLKDQLHDYKYSSYSYGIDYETLKLAIQKEYGEEAVQALVAKQRALVVPRIMSEVDVENFPTHADLYPELYVDNNDEAMKSFLVMKAQIMKNREKSEIQPDKPDDTETAFTVFDRLFLP